MQDDKVGQVKKKTEKLQLLLKSVNKDIEYKHKELQNLMRIQEDRSRRNSIRIKGIVESPKENWKDTENKLCKMLYNYFDITEGVIIERTHRVEKREKSKQEPRTIPAKLLDCKYKEYILKNTHRMKHTDIWYLWRFLKRNNGNMWTIMWRS